MTLHHGGGLDALLVILEPLGWLQPRHADINAWLGRISFWIGLPNLRAFCGFPIQQHHIDMVVHAGVLPGILGSDPGLQTAKRPPLHARITVLENVDSIRSAIFSS